MKSIESVALGLTVPPGFKRMTKTMISMQLTVREATMIFSDLTEKMHEWRMKEIATLCSLLSKHQSRMMRD